MSLVAVTSPRSSPGATSLCVGLALAWKGWDLDPLLIEADPAGGVLGHRFNVTGSRAQRNLLTFSVDTRRSFRGEAMVANLQSILGFEALLGPVKPQRAVQAVQQATPVIAAHLAPSKRPIVVDLGRIMPQSPALELARVADRVYVVIEPQVDQVQAALFQVASLRSVGANVQLVFVGDRPFAPDDVSALADTPIAAVLPHSVNTAAALSGGKFNKASLSRSPLWRAIVALARPLAVDLMAGSSSSLSTKQSSKQSSKSGPPPAPVVLEPAVSGPPAPPAPPPVAEEDAPSVDSATARADEPERDSDEPERDSEEVDDLMVWVAET